MVNITLETEDGVVSITRDNLGDNSTWPELVGMFFNALHSMEYSYLPPGSVVAENIKEFIDELQE